MGVLSTRLSLRPHNFEGNVDAKPGRDPPREREGASDHYRRPRPAAENRSVILTIFLALRLAAFLV
jgi:hypothetical protein